MKWLKQLDQNLRPQEQHLPAPPFDLLNGYSTGKEEGNQKHSSYNGEIYSFNIEKNVYTTRFFDAYL